MLGTLYRATACEISVSPRDIASNTHCLNSFKNLDLESDLSELYDSFDVIHVRAVASQVNSLHREPTSLYVEAKETPRRQIVDFERVTGQLFNALKPHGVLLLVAGEQCFYGPDRSPLPQDQSLMQRAMRLLHEYTL